MSTPLTGPESGSPPPLPTAAAPSYVRLPKNPILATFLSGFPGLGQVYNGQPAKAMVFFFGFVGAIYGTAQISPFPFAFLIPFVYFYGMIDAYKSAVQINAKAAGGTLVDEDTAESPAWGWSLIGLGALLLAHTLGWLNFIAFERYWPVLLIAGGIGVLLKSRVKR